MKVLVTGGAGYVGSHVCKALRAAGHEPTTYDSLDRGHRWAVRWGPLIEGDVRDRDALATAFAALRPDAVVHMAALAYVGESVEQPDLYEDVNVGGSTNLIALCREYGVKRFVFSSSCSVYGVPESCPIDESFRMNPISPYGRTKQTVEEMLRAEDGNGMGSVSLRYFNAVGADPAGETGELHEPETHLVPLAIEAALGRTDGLAVFGTDYPTHDGTAIRDYVHVSDLADAHVLALSYLRRGGETTALNLGSGVAASVREVVAAVADVAGRGVPVVEQGRRAGDPPVLTADASRAREVLSWTPRHAALRDMVAGAYAWHLAGRRPAGETPPA